MRLDRSRWMLIGLVLAMAGIGAFTLYFRHGYDALVLLADLAHINFPLSNSPPAVSRRGISYQANGQRRDADLYVPEFNVRAGMVLVPGAAEQGRNDPRLVDFATSMARSGFAVLVPDILALRQLQPSPGSAREINDAFVFLRDEKDLVPSGWLGISAFSIAVGPAVLAALDPSISGRVNFLFLVGGYHDMVRTLTFLTTGYFDVDGRLQYRQPNEYGKWVYALSNSRSLQDPSGRAALAALARRKLDNTEAPVDDLRARLDPAGEAVYEFISNTDPARVPMLINLLPPAVQADIAALNLASYDLSGLKAKVILMHGRDDDVIPYTESISLAAAFPKDRVNLYLLEGLHHVDRDFRGLDLWHSWLAMQDLLTQDRD